MSPGNGEKRLFNFSHNLWENWLLSVCDSLSRRLLDVSDILHQQVETLHIVQITDGQAFYSRKNISQVIAQCPVKRSALFLPGL